MSGQMAPALMHATHPGRSPHQRHASQVGVLRHSVQHSCSTLGRHTLGYLQCSAGLPVQANSSEEFARRLAPHLPQQT